MSCNTTDDVRIIMKYSTISGATPSIPLSDNHEDGTWLPTDLYIGEFFTNAADDTFWIRTDNGISQLFGGTGGTGSFIGDFVNISGGTFSGLVFAPTFSANYLVGGTVSADTITADYFIGGTYSGDGSLLTGIVANWLGGTVSDGVYFTNEAKFTNDTWLDGDVYSTSGINISGSVSVSGGILTSDYFVGDGSGLTNLPTGTYSDIYTTGATLSGDTIIFTRNDSNTYDIDLTPILNQQSITTMTWDSSTDELLTTFNDASTIGLTIDSFAQVSSTGPITAPEFYGGIFYGEFVGTFSNDIYTISGTLSGTDEIFTRTDGSTFSVDLSSLAGGGGGTQSLEQTLILGNTTGANDISVDYSRKIFSSYTYSTSNYEHKIGFGNNPGNLQIVTINNTNGKESRIELSGNGNGEIQVDNALNINTPSFTVADTSGGTAFAGIEYDTDYSSNYTNRSLIDKEYVDNAVGASSTLEQTLVLGNTTGANDIIVDNSSEIIFGTASGLLFNNTSRLREGTIDAGYGGNKGIAQICAVGYEMKWESGSLYIMNGDGTEIREVRYTFGATPLATDDVTKGFTIGSRWVLDNGDLYTCSDTATSSAVWNLEATGIGSLEQTLAIGNTTGTYSILAPNNSGLSNYNGVQGSKGITFDNDAVIMYAGTSSFDDGGPLGFVSVLNADGSISTQTQANVEYNMNYFGNGSGYFSVSGYTGFKGIEYASDYSGSYSVRSLVDKEYVDNTVSGATSSLSDVLSVGNTTGANDIIVDNDIRIKTTDTGYIQFGDTGSDLNAISVNNGGDGVTTPSNGFGFSGVDPYWTSQVNDIAGIIDTISLDPQGLVNGTGIKSEDTTTTDYSQTTHTPTNILSTITDNGFGYFSSKEIKPQQHQTQFLVQANIFTIEDKRAGWMQTADDTAALMIYCDVDGSTGSTSSIVQIKAHVRGISSDKLTGYAAEITSWVRLDELGPTVITQIGTVDYTIKSEFTTANSSFVISGPNMYIDVTGEIGITIDWTCNVEILYDKNTF